MLMIEKMHGLDTSGIPTPIKLKKKTHNKPTTITKTTIHSP
jgi:hypothetical protein